MKTRLSPPPGQLGIALQLHRVLHGPGRGRNRTVAPSNLHTGGELPCPIPPKSVKPLPISLPACSPARFRGSRSPSSAFRQQKARKKRLRLQPSRKLRPRRFRHRRRQNNTLPLPVPPRSRLCTQAAFLCSPRSVDAPAEYAHYTYPAWPRHAIRPTCVLKLGQPRHCGSRILNDFSSRPTCSTRLPNVAAPR